MPTSYPGGLDSYTNKVDGVTDVLAADTNNLQDAMVAVQTRVGTTANPTFVPRAGGTMTGPLTTTGVTTNAVTISSTAPQINMVDTDQGTTRYLHVNSNLMGFLNTGGGWDLYANNSGQVWTANYGWLHDYFFSSVSNCATQGNGNCGNTGNCYNGPGNCTTVVANCGNLSATVPVLEDGGSTINLRSYRYNFNCNCNCDCGNCACA